MPVRAWLVVGLVACASPPANDDGDVDELVSGNCTITGIAPVVDGAMVGGQIGWTCDGGSYPTQFWEVGLDEAPPDSEDWNFIGESFYTETLAQGGSGTGLGNLIFTEPRTCYRTEATDTPNHRFHVVSSEVACF